MSLGISRKRTPDVAPGVVAIGPAELGPMPDDVATDPRAAWVDPRSWFASPDNALEIDIGSGKGSFLVQQAARRLGANYLGIEYAREFFVYAADRVRRHGLANVRLLHADALEHLAWRVPDGIVAVIHLYFPDPWPKKKHHKRRMLQDRFLEHAHRVLVPGGEVRVVTDHDEYWDWMERHFAAWTESSRSTRFVRREFEPPESAGPSELVGTNFERKYRREGRPFHAAVLRKPVSGSRQDNRASSGSES